MTLSLAWVRTCTDSRELVVATDSRLTGGKKWDCAPKIFSLPRSDSLICFAGETNYAYPLMTQMASAIEQYPQSRSREMDITHMKGHTLRIWNRMIQEVEDLPSGYESANPDSIFVLSGYSWKQKKFYIWLLHYDNEISKYTYKPVRKWEGIDGYKKVAITGDRRLEAKDKLREILEEKGKLRKGGLDFEPLTVLVEMIRDESCRPIGGPPQVMKIYQHMNTVPFIIPWPDSRSGSPTLLGRPLLDYEKTHYPILDLDTFEVSSGWDF